MAVVASSPFYFNGRSLWIFLLLIIVSLLPNAVSAQSRLNDQEVKELKEQYLFLFNKSVEMQNRLNAVSRGAGGKMDSLAGVIEVLSADVQKLERQLRNQVPASSKNKSADVTALENRLKKLEAGTGNGGTSIFSSLLLWLLIPFVGAALYASFILYKKVQNLKSEAVIYEQQVVALESKFSSSLSEIQKHLDLKIDELLKVASEKPAPIYITAPAKETVQPEPTPPDTPTPPQINGNHFTPATPAKDASETAPAEAPKTEEVLRNNYIDLEDRLKQLSLLKGSYINKLLHINNLSDEANELLNYLPKYSPGSAGRVEIEQKIDVINSQIVELQREI